MEPEVPGSSYFPCPLPSPDPPLVIVATAVLVELHVTELVRFCVLLSLYVPVAVYCWVVPLAMEALAGVTASDTSVALPCW